MEIEKKMKYLSIYTTLYKIWKVKEEIENSMHVRRDKSYLIFFKAHPLVCLLSIICR